MPRARPAAPPLPGLRLRSPAGPDDADALLALRHACAARDGFDPLSTTESLPTREELAGLPAAECVVAEIDGRVVGYGRFTDWVEVDGTHVWLTLGWVGPEWRGRGVGTALLRWTERAIRAAARPGRWEFAANASNTEPDATALLRDNGYAPAYTVLEMGLDWAAFAPATRLPPGVEMRPAGAEHTPLITASIDEAYRDEYPGGRFAVRFDPVAEAAELAGDDHDPALWRVAWAGNEVVGQVIPIIARGRAEIYEVSVRPGWRRGGVARALLSDALLGLQARGVAVVRLHTVAEFRTRAVDLYESLGFRVVKEFPRYRKR